MNPSPESGSAGQLQALQRFWDARYDSDDFAFGTQPNDFLVQRIGLSTQHGRALCPAEGEGRNGVWLAQQGWQVTAVDLSARGLQKAQQLARAQGVRLETIVRDLTTFDPGPPRRDLIVSIFVHLDPAARKRLHAACIAALSPGGCFLYEGFGPEPGEEGRYATLADVVADFSAPAIKIEHRFTGGRMLREGRLHVGERVVVQIAARKRAA